MSAFRLRVTQSISRFYCEMEFPNLRPRTEFEKECSMCLGFFLTAVMQCYSGLVVTIFMNHRLTPVPHKSDAFKLQISRLSSNHKIELITCLA